MAEPKNYRLPRSVTPERYELRLAPDLASWTFTGTAVIAVAVHEPVQEIALNAAELELQSVLLRSADGRSTPGQAQLDSDTEQAILNFGGTVAPGRYQLELHFSGVLNDKLHGFYRSTYKDADGRERRLASTQFESTDARRAFPCWDEPALKAVEESIVGGVVVGDRLVVSIRTRVERGGPLEGRTVGDVIEQYGCGVVERRPARAAIPGAEPELFPSPRTVLERGDEVMLEGPYERIGELRRRVSEVVVVGT